MADDIDLTDTDQVYQTPDQLNSSAQSAEDSIPLLGESSSSTGYIDTAPKTANVPIDYVPKDTDTPSSEDWSSLLNKGIGVAGDVAKTGIQAAAGNASRPSSAPSTAPRPPAAPASAPVASSAPPVTTALAGPVQTALAPGISTNAKLAIGITGALGLAALGGGLVYAVSRRRRRRVST